MGGIQLTTAGTFFAGFVGKHVGMLDYATIACALILSGGYFGSSPNTLVGNILGTEGGEQAAGHSA